MVNSSSSEGFGPPPPPLSQILWPHYSKVVLVVLSHTAVLALKLKNSWHYTLTVGWDKTKQACVVQCCVFFLHVANLVASVPPKKKLKKKARTCSVTGVRNKVPFVRERERERERIIFFSDALILKPQK